MSYYSQVYDFTDDELYALIGKKKKYDADKISLFDISKDIRFKNNVLQQLIEIVITSPGIQTISDEHHFYFVWVDVPNKSTD